MNRYQVKIQRQGMRSPAIYFVDATDSLAAAGRVLDVWGPNADASGVIWTVHPVPVQSEPVPDVTSEFEGVAVSIAALLALAVLAVVVVAVAVLR